MTKHETFGAPWLIGAVLAALCLHCSSSSSSSDAAPAPNPAGTTSGSRLELQSLTNGDAHQFYGIRDSQADSACVFGPDDAGVLRCFPDFTVGNANYFADASCTTHVGLVFDGACTGAKPKTLPAWSAGSSISSDACSSDSVVNTFYIVGDELPLTSLYQLDSGSCQPAQVVGQQDKVYATTKGDSSTLVSAKVESRLIGKRLELQVYVGDDGSVIPGDGSGGISLSDAMTGMKGVRPLFVHEDANSGGDVRYVALALSADPMSGTFVDSSCKAPAVTTTPCEDVSTAIAFETTYDATQCTSDTQAFSIESTQVPAGSMSMSYQLSNGVCSPAGPLAAGTVLTVGAPSTFDPFVGGKIVRVGTGRLQSLVAQNDDGSTVEMGTFFDTALGISCAVSFFASGTYCMGGGQLGVAFSDAACTVRIAVSPTADQDCASAPHTAYEQGTADASTCNQVSGQFYLTSTSLGTVQTYAMVSGACVSQGMSNAFTIAKPLALTDFAPLTLE